MLAVPFFTGGLAFPVPPPPGPALPADPVCDPPAPPPPLVVGVPLIELVAPAPPLPPGPLFAPAVPTAVAPPPPPPESTQLGLDAGAAAPPSLPCAGVTGGVLPEPPL